MRDKFYHENLFRGQRALEKLGAIRLVACGAGAVGSNLLANLARQGLSRIRVIDFDRVEAHNIGTQTYSESDIGMFKAEAIQAEIFRAVGIEIETAVKKLDSKNVRKLLKNADLAVDGFDNHDSRKVVTDYCRETGVPCVHVGLSADYAEIVWNETYRVPQDAAQGDVCDYPMARNLVQFAAALASEVIVRFALTGEKQSYSFTLRDFKISRTYSD